MESAQAAAQEGARASRLQMVGRDSELAVLHGFLDGAGAQALVVTGDAGIGKTTLWQAGVDAASERGYRVLTARASSAEARLSHAALIDLLGGISREELAGLPEPQIHALEVALLRAEPAAPPPDAAVALGLLNALRSLAERPLLVAVDDVPWVDAPSAAALTFAARRLDGDGPRFLFARRPGRASSLEQAFASGLVDRLELGPLSYGAIRRLLSERLGLVLPRHVLRRLVDTTLGNPLYALELGRELASSSMPAIGEDLPVPDAVEDLLGRRVARLPADTRRLLLATALCGDLTAAQLGAIAGVPAVEEAIDRGLLVDDGGRLRASHPLLAVAARKRSRPRERRELHLALASVVAEDELRARHLALAADGVDEELAAIAAKAASTAAARGAREDAVELGEHALRLTPPGSAERVERLLGLAEHLATAGQERRLTELLGGEIDALPSGPPRARAHLLLVDGTVSHIDECMEHLESALVEARDDRALRARALAKRSAYMAMVSVEGLRAADEWAQQARIDARELGPEVELDVLHALAWTSILRGRSIEALRERCRALSAGPTFLLYSVERVAAIQLGWRGNVSEARRLLHEISALADHRGEAASYAVLRLQRLELELRAGDLEAATLLLDEWRHSGDRELMAGPSYDRCLALLAAGRGSPEDADRWAGRVVETATASGVRWGLLEALRARGIAALLAHEPHRAADCLRDVWEHTEREGVDDPGAFPAAPDLVEALVACGELEEARAVTSRLRGLAEQQAHPWGLTTWRRCDALVALADGGYEPEAAVALGSATDEYAALGLRFDAARSLLALGRAQRRHRKWAGARASLERAVSAFEELGSPGWAAAARSELQRVGGRRPRSDDQLTPTEERVVELAAAGLSNKEIARRLVVTVNTVETHLSRAYAKLGVRSRAQLARQSGPGR